MIELKKLRSILGWSAVINMSLLLLMAVLVLGAKQLVYDVWGYFFKLSPEEYDSFMLYTLAFWKVLVFIFFIIPYIAIGIVEKEKAQS